MVTKENLTPDEWTTLRDAPHVVALAVMSAGASGITGTVVEGVALARGMVEGRRASHDLIRALAAPDEIKAAQEAVRASLAGTPPAQLAGRIKMMALDRVRAAVALLNSKGTADDVKAYSDWISGLAQQVAESAKEGAFLGFGGQRVSEGETAVLKEIAAALGRSA